MNGRLRLLIRKTKAVHSGARFIGGNSAVMYGFLCLDRGLKSGEVNDNTSTISAGSGLVFIGENINSGVITLDNSIKLEDCSSADGRNFFFRLSVI